ncbi:MAG TPA: hypothetical protein VIL33_00010 [Rhodothermia bacterium]
MSTLDYAGEYPVSDNKVTFFRENGYVRFDNVLSMEEVEALRTVLADAMDHRQGFVRDLAKKSD